tara:strand:+ start:30 stop:431 length:402 start_codon:yes stop_codon:yes gene_type:complete
MNYTDCSNYIPVGTELCKPEEIVIGEAKTFTFGKKPKSFNIFLIRVADSSTTKNKSYMNIHAYINNCPHKNLPLDWSPGKFFDLTKEFIQCSSHGALFRLNDGLCIKGPCFGKSLSKIDLFIKKGILHIGKEQ